MTFRRFILKHLTDNGMFDSQAMDVMIRIENSPDLASMGSRWGDNMGDYPEAMARIVLMAARREALAWIEENMPLAWYKPMFQ